MNEKQLELFATALANKAKAYEEQANRCLMNLQKAAAFQGAAIALREMANSFAEMRSMIQKENTSNAGEQKQ